MDQQTRWEESARYWQTVPRSANAVLLTGVFFMFTAVGIVMTFFNEGWLHVGWAILLSLITGVFAVAWAYAGFRRIIPLLIVLFPVQFAANWTLGAVAGHYLTPVVAGDLGLKEIEHRLRIEAGIMLMTLVASYVLIVYFIRSEGKRIFGHFTEIRLAREVHRTLVPEINCRIGPYELYGISVPSGQVGGDLVDVMQSGSHWVAYVADVAGHGVAAGMIMAMVKSATHMGSSEGLSLAALLTNLNRVLKRLSGTNVFATYACIAGRENSTIEFSLAGHHPILHYRRSAHSVEERSTPNPVLGIFGEATFQTASMTYEEGDVLAVVTDGLTEAADKSGRELGLQPLKNVLMEAASRPLQQAALAMRTAALRYGTQIDDQTMLLVRRTEKVR